MNPTKAQIKHRNRIWAEALLTHQRKTRSKMYDGKGGRCCLAVAQDIAIEHGVKVDKKESLYAPYRLVADFFGWDSIDPQLWVNVNGKREFINASGINDGNSSFSSQKNRAKGLTHPQIAECVLNTFVHPKSPKSTFSA